MVWLNHQCSNQSVPSGTMGGSMCICPECVAKRSKPSPPSKWDLRFLELASLVASWSKDPSTKCGAVITNRNKIISLGFNGFPAPCLDLDEFYSDRELKLERVLHAEINAILFSRQSLENFSIYTQPFPPCARCAATIIQAGIKRVVAPEPSGSLQERWEQSLSIAKQMYIEAGVRLILV